MKKILLFVFSLFWILVSVGQTEYYWRNDQSSAAGGQWNNANNWWNGSAAELPGGSEILSMNGSVGQFMTNDLPSANRFQIFLKTGGAARSISGSTENTFYDYSNNNPKIENQSSNGLSIDFPIKIGYDPMELNPVSGPIAFSKQIDNNGNSIYVWGNNAQTLGIGGNIIGTGGLTIKQNSTVSFFSTPKTYSGNTTLEAGVLDMQISAANTSITVKSGAKLSINGDNVNISNLNVESGGTVEILSGKSLTVNGDLTNNGTFTIKSDANGTGSLITLGSVSGGGVIVERYIPGYNKGTGFHLISSPVADQAISDFDTEGGSDDFYKWDEPTFTWINRTATGGGLNGDFETEFNVGKGYLIALPSNTTKSFSGNLNNADVSFTGTHTNINGGGNDGWNLIGNPYASAVQWDKSGDSWGRSNIEGIAKYYDENGSNNYVSINQGDYIPAMQGFFVQVSAVGTGSLTIKKASRAHGGSGWMKSDNTEMKSLKLKVSGGANSYYDIFRVNLIEDATDGYDLDYDSHKLFGDALAPQFYAILDQENYSDIAFNYGRSKKNFDLAFRAGTDGEYTIEVVLNTLDILDDVYLEDIVEHVTIDLNKTNTYTFSATTADNENRFKLHFGATGIKDIEEANLQAYMSGNNLTIVGEEGQAQLRIFDIQGKLLMNKQVELSTTYRQSLLLPAGVYVISLQSNSIVKTNKIVIK